MSYTTAVSITILSRSSHISLTKTQVTKFCYWCTLISIVRSIIIPSPSHPSHILVTLLLLRFLLYYKSSSTFYTIMLQWSLFDAALSHTASLAMTVADDNLSIYLQWLLFDWQIMSHCYFNYGCYVSWSTSLCYNDHFRSPVTDYCFCLS